MRLAFIAMVCAACSTPPSPPDASSAFAFTGDYTLEPNITSATLGSASFVGGQTIHVELTYATYDASFNNYEVAEITAYGIASSFTIGPSCPCSNAGTPYAATETDTVEWSPGSDEFWVQGGFTCYYPPGMGPCAGTVN